MKIITNLTERLYAMLRKDYRAIADPDQARQFLKERVRVENHWTFDHLRDEKQIDQWAFDNLVVTEGLNLLLNRSFDTVPANVNWFVGLIGPGAGTVAITTATAAVTGTGTTFTTELDNAPIADIIIVGAGAAGADLIQTVLTFTSGTAITLSGNASTTVSGAAYATELVASDTLVSHITGWTEGTPYSNATRPGWTKNGAAAAGAMSNSTSKASFSINATARVYGAFLATDSTKGGTAGSLYGGGLFTSTGSRSVLSGDTLNAQVDLSVTAS